MIDCRLPRNPTAEALIDAAARRAYWIEVDPAGQAFTVNNSEAPYLAGNRILRVVGDAE